MRREPSTGYSLNEYRLRRGGEVRNNPRCNRAANKSAILRWMTTFVRGRTSYFARLSRGLHPS